MLEEHPGCLYIFAFKALFKTDNIMYYECISILYIHQLPLCSILAFKFIFINYEIYIII